MAYLYQDETYRIIGAAMEVHKTLGCGFLESVYQEALEKEFILQNIPFAREVVLPIYYKNQLLQKTFIADFICFEKIIVELKSLSQLSNEHHAQVLNYLKATNYKIGLLINFGKQSLEYKRIIFHGPQDHGATDYGSADYTNCADYEE
jgi:GxxExxY protein